MEREAEMTSTKRGRRWSYLKVRKRKNSRNIFVLEKRAKESARGGGVHSWKEKEECREGRRGEGVMWLEEVTEATDNNDMTMKEKMEENGPANNLMIRKGGSGDSSRRRKEGKKIHSDTRIDAQYSKDEISKNKITWTKLMSYEKETLLVNRHPLERTTASSSINCGYILDANLLPLRLHQTMHFKW